MVDNTTTIHPSPPHAPEGLATDEQHEGRVPGHVVARRQAPVRGGVHLGRGDGRLVRLQQLRGEGVRLDHLLAVAAPRGVELDKQVAVLVDAAKRASFILNELWASFPRVWRSPLDIVATVLRLATYPKLNFFGLRRDLNAAERSD